MTGRPYAQRLNALRAAKAPPCGCGHGTHANNESHVGHEHGAAPKIVPSKPNKPVSIPSGYRNVGALDSRGA